LINHEGSDPHPSTSGRFVIALPPISAASQSRGSSTVSLFSSSTVTNSLTSKEATETTPHPTVTVTNYVPTPTFDNSAHDVSTQRNIGAIVGGVVGGVLGILFLCALGFFWYQRRKVPKYHGMSGRTKDDNVTEVLGTARFTG
jgi:hypothetical protein